VLLGLQSNAIKYTTTGHVKHIVSIKDDCLEVKIEDTGLGISDENLSRLFQLFGKIEND
jgi:signal transduction histidine kinase